MLQENSGLSYTSNVAAKLKRFDSGTCIGSQSAAANVAPFDTQEGGFYDAPGGYALARRVRDSE